jgi:hypothetical protein
MFYLLSHYPIGFCISIIMNTKIKLGNDIITAHIGYGTHTTERARMDRSPTNEKPYTISQVNGLPILWI